MMAPTIDGPERSPGRPRLRPCRSRPVPASAARRTNSASRVADVRASREPCPPLRAPARQRRWAGERRAAVVPPRSPTPALHRRSLTSTTNRTVRKHCGRRPREISGWCGPAGTFCRNRSLSTPASGVVGPCHHGRSRTDGSESRGGLRRGAPFVGSGHRPRDHSAAVSPPTRNGGRSLEKGVIHNPGRGRLRVLFSPRSTRTGRRHDARTWRGPWPGSASSPWSQSPVSSGTGRRREPHTSGPLLRDMVVGRRGPCRAAGVPRLASLGLRPSRAAVCGVARSLIVHSRRANARDETCRGAGGVAFRTAPPVPVQQHGRSGGVVIGCSLGPLAQRLGVRTTEAEGGPERWRLTRRGTARRSGARPSDRDRTPVVGWACRREG